MKINKKKNAIFCDGFILESDICAIMRIYKRGRCA